MPTQFIKASQLVPEEGSAIFTVAFTDEDDAAVTPNSGLTWTLTNASGTVINSRSAVALTPASSVTIKLSGDDLAIGANGIERHLLIQGTYASGGDTLNIRDSAIFFLDNLVAVT